MRAGFARSERPVRFRDVVRRVAWRASGSVLAGPSMDDALHMAWRMAQLRVASTISYWSAPQDEPRAVADACTAAIARMRFEGLDCRLSVRAQSLGFSPSLLQELAQAAASAGIALHLDAPRPEHADRVLRLVEDLSPRAGCTLPGRWPRSQSDALRAAALRLPVRIVKGEWADPADPGYAAAPGCLAVIDRIAGRVPKVAVATHDAGLARAALHRLQVAGTPCEMELLHGLSRRACLRAARDMGVPVRLYIPYGPARGLAASRRAWEGAPDSALWAAALRLHP